MDIEICWVWPWQRPPHKEWLGKHQNSMPHNLNLQKRQIPYLPFQHTVFRWCDMSFGASKAIFSKVAIAVAKTNKFQCPYLNISQWYSTDIGYFFIRLVILNYWGIGCNIFTCQCFISKYVLILTKKREDKAPNLRAPNEIVRGSNPFPKAAKGWLR